VILVDSSVWISHFRSSDNTLVALLEENWVLTHPFVIGELACGNLKNRATILGDLSRIGRAELAQHEEALELADTLRGKGIGWIDVHLIASALLSAAQLWTLDERLRRAASAANIRVFRPSKST
jgi:predicted nucleic acid-binding protein